MAVKAITKQGGEQREKRAKSIAAMGLVNREGDRFKVSTPSLRGKQTAYEVWRDAAGKVRCSCLEFEEASAEDSSFRCEHILAVKFAVLAKTSEAVVNKNVTTEAKPAPQTPVEVSAETSNSNKQTTQNVTEAGEKSAPAEQQLQSLETKNINGQDILSTNKPRIEKVRPQVRLVSETPALTDNTEDKEFEMQKVQAAEVMPNDSETRNSNVLEFSSTLRALRENVNPDLVKQREGWKDRNGNVHMVDYVEWHTVADILDENAPNWSHTIRDIKEIGSFIAVTAAITIDGVTREGVGTGEIDSEMGIKKAEHDALKRAAVKFGIARDLYRRESEVIEREGSTNPPNNDGGFPANPIARSISDLITSKQLGMIRAITREMTIDANDECQKVMKCTIDELSKRAASSFIQHLQTAQSDAQNAAPANARRAV